MGRLANASRRLQPLTATHVRRHLLFAGLDPFAAQAGAMATSLRVAPLDRWLASVTHAPSHNANDLEVIHVAAGDSHSLIAYRDNATSIERVLAVGRNSSGQLGIGFNSNEPTRGFVEGFEGIAIREVHASLAGSFLEVEESGAVL